MNIDQWISCISEAYEIIGETLSPRKKQILLGELSEDNLNRDEDTRYAIAFGVIKKPLTIQDEFLNDVIDETTELVTRYFFKKVALRETFGSIIRVEQRFGCSLETNYDISSGPFIDMTKTYWTYRLEIEELFPKYYNLVLSQVLLQVEGDIGSVFFPFPGPSIIWVGQRREKQRQLLEQYTPEMDIDAFLDNNPILGTSKGRIAETVFNEKVWVRCPNPSCSTFLKIPNTVKRLEITCPECKTSFLFPSEELNCLNHLEPCLHPAPHKIKELESLRQLWNIPDEVFAMGITSTDWATEQIQRKLYEEAKQMNPRAPDKEIFREIIMARTGTRIPYGLNISEEELDKAIKSINSVDDLVEFVSSKESGEPPWPDPLGIKSRVEEILRG